MGTIGNAIKKEIGKNTGKVVSNILFGDMHSTPYRRANSAKTKAAEAKIERQNKEQLFTIDSAVLENIDAVASYRISNDIDELLHQLSELSVQLKANKWSETANSEEAKIRNKFCDALFEKYKQSLRKLQEIAPENPQIAYYDKIKKRTNVKKYLGTYPTWIGLGAFFTLSFFYFWIDSLESSELNLLLVIVSGLVIISISMMAYFRIRAKKNKEKKISHTDILTKKPTDYFGKKDHIDNSYFIDLNENNRIELCLTQIWNKYKHLIDNKIISRKPIFSTDAVQDSILYIGVNPSYNALDDELLILSEDKNSLMYGSLYKIPNAPLYFKGLELFADKINVGYSHINLLYARENDRELLLNCDQNFIREQLELTYATILKAKPIVVVFLSDYCKNLILGEGRWVNPLKNPDDHYVLNGTTIPVVFTEDITILTESEKECLKMDIQNLINKH